MNITIPNWLSQLLGGGAAETGEGIVARSESSWPLAPWLTLLLLLGCAVFALSLYWTERGGMSRTLRIILGTIRFVLIAIVLWMIAEWIMVRERTGLPYVVVFVDDSASMSKIDRYDDENLRQRLNERLQHVGLEGLSRINLAKLLLLENNAELLDQVDQRYKLKVYFVSNAARAQTGTLAELRDKIKNVEATGEQSRLGPGVRSILNDLRGAPPAAMILLTDGINTDGETLPEVATYARRKGVPLFPVGLGTEQGIHDVELTDLLVDDVVFVNDVVNFECKLTAAGYAGQRVDVVLKDKASGNVLAHKTVDAGADDQAQRVRIPYRPTQVGDFEYVVEATPLADEANLDNNRQQRAVSVRKEQIRVLLVQAYPNYEFRYLKHLLQRDAATIDLKTVLQDADVEYADIDKTALRVFPVRREELFEYDVIVLGDVNPAQLSTSVMNNLADFVKEKGGGLVLVAGPLFNPTAYRGTPLAALLPMDVDAVSAPEANRSITDGFVVQPTDLGLASPPMQLGDTPAETADIWKKLPELFWLAEIRRLKPAARVLAEHPTKLMENGQRMPVMIMQYVGAGKVIYHATDDLWRWRYRVGDVFLSRYWVQTTRYLSRSRLLGKDRSAELTTDRREYRWGEPVRLRVRFIDDRQAPAQDDGVTVVLERQGDKNERIPLRRSASERGTFEGIFSRPTQGSYHAWIAEPTLSGQAPAVDFQVVAPPGESERVRMDAAELSRAAEETNGRFYRVSDAGSLLADLPEGRQVPIESLPPRPLWNRWEILAVFLSLLVTEWILRKRQGLL